MSVYITNTIEGQAAVEDGKWDDIKSDAAKHRRSRVTVENWSEDREWSEQQRKWWKGVLLPKLAEHTGDSLAYWENKLKLAVLPDDFKPIGVQVGVAYYFYLPSITILGIKKMKQMVEGSVAHLRDEKIYGEVFHWVTLPDRDLRSKKCL